MTTGVSCVKTPTFLAHPSQKNITRLVMALRKGAFSGERYNTIDHPGKK